MTRFCTASRILALGLLLSNLICFQVCAVQFVPLLEQSCQGSSPYALTVGQQYIDAGNGVPGNSFSMLRRWQKDPIAKADCSGGQFLLNTWIIPRTPVVGGGYNDMFGWSWDEFTAPMAFPDTSDLVVQALIGVSNYQVHLGSGPRYVFPNAQLALFAYFRDVTHPSLHPIAVVALFKANAENPNSAAPMPFGVVSFDYPTGVFFSAFNTVEDTPYSVRDPFGNNVEILGTARWNPLQPKDFVRMRISPSNWVNTINAINSHPCSACPAKGYSVNPAHYQLLYAGLIGEVVLGDSDDGSLGNPAKDQIVWQVDFSSLGIYRRYP